MRNRKHSIKIKVLKQLSILMVLLFLAFAIITVNRSYQAVNLLLDDTLEKSIEPLLSQLIYNPETGKLYLNLDTNIFPEFGAGQNDGLFQIQEVNSTKIIFRSPSLGEHSIEKLSLGDFPDFGEKETFWNDRLLENEHYRCIGIIMTPQSIDSGYESILSGLMDSEHLMISDQIWSGPPLLRIIVAFESDNAYRRLGQMLLYTGLLFVVMFCIVLGVTALMLQVSFKSLSTLSKEIEEIDPVLPRFSISIPDEKETSIVGTAVNSFLLRLKKSLAWEREITSNIAHELRTPVSALRNVIEVALLRDRSVKDYQDVLTDSLSITYQMQRIVENMLELSRLESDQVTVLKERINLKEIVLESLRIIEKNIPNDIEVTTDRGKILIVLNNLLDNAVNHTAENGVIEITVDLCKEKSNVILNIKNSGKPLSDEEIENIFKRFYRIDSSRSESKHLGLGLNLVNSLCSLLDIKCSACSEPNVALSVSLTIPLQASN